MKKNRTVSVVIPCLNCACTVGRLVSSLREQRLPEETELEIVVVDNGSTDGTAALLEGLPVRTVRQPVPGPAAARNAGVRAARGEIIVFLDADTRPADDQLIAQHLATLETGENVGIAGGAISPDPEQKSLIAFAENATALFNWHHRLPQRALSFQPAGNLAFRRSLFEQIGPMDERMLWLEDFEWSTRVVRAGRAILFNPEAGVYIRGRDSMLEAVRKFYAWGLNVRSAYVPGRLGQLWLFKDHPWLFLLNAPLRVLNETWVTLKRWLPVCPARALMLTPLFLLFRSAWAAGMIVGSRRHFRSGRAAALAPSCVSRKRDE